MCKIRKNKFQFDWMKNTHKNRSKKISKNRINRNRYKSISARSKNQMCIVNTSTFVERLTALLCAMKLVCVVFLAYNNSLYYSICCCWLPQQTYNSFTHTNTNTHTQRYIQYTHHYNTFNFFFSHFFYLPFCNSLLRHLSQQNLFVWLRIVQYRCRSFVTTTSKCALTNLRAQFMRINGFNVKILWMYGIVVVDTREIYTKSMSFLTNALDVWFNVHMKFVLSSPTLERVRWKCISVKHWYYYHKNIYRLVLDENWIAISFKTEIIHSLSIDCLL